MSIHCTDCQKLYRTHKAHDAVHRSQIIAKDAEITKLREENQRVQKVSKIMAPKLTWKEFAKAIEIQAKIEVLEDIMEQSKYCASGTRRFVALMIDKLKQLEGK